MRRAAVTGRRRARASRCKGGCARRGGEASIGVVRRTPPAALLSALVALLLVPAAAPAAGGVLVMDAHGHVRAHRDAAAATTAEARPSAAAARALRAAARDARPRADDARVGPRRPGRPRRPRRRHRRGAHDLGRGLAERERDAEEAPRRATRAARRGRGQPRRRWPRAGRLTPSRAAAGVPDARAQPRLVGAGPAAALRRSACGFAGSELVWQFYPGQGIQVQWLGHVRQGQRGLRRQGQRPAARLLGRGPGARRRSAPAAWPSSTLFQFDGGRPPWVSSLAQGTGTPGAVARRVAPGRPRLRPTPRAARWAIFRTPPPEGVRVATRGRGPLPPVLLRAEAAHRQRLRAVAQRPARLAGSAQRRRRARRCSTAGEAELRARAARASTRARGRCTRAPARASPTLELPRAAARLPALAVRPPDDGREKAAAARRGAVLRSRAALHRRPHDAARPRASPTSGRAASTAMRLRFRCRQDLAR